VLRIPSYFSFFSFLPYASGPLDNSPEKPSSRKRDYNRIESLHVAIHPSPPPQHPQRTYHCCWRTSRVSIIVMIIIIIVFGFRAVPPQPGDRKPMDEPCGSSTVSTAKRYTPYRVIIIALIKYDYKKYW
jgi:hypothetical protein